MSKLTLSDVGTILTSGVTINANNSLVETALENTLSRDGTSPNQMEADLDLNSFRLINLGTPTSVLDAARLIDITAAGGAVGVTPTGTVGLVVVPGVATTCPRSDSAPALSQAIAPSWTGVHSFTLRTQFADGTVLLPGIGLGSQTSTGFYKDTAGQIGISLAGVTAGQIAQGSATLTATGMTTSPTCTMTWRRVGMQVIAKISSLSATSNSTSYSLTGLPAAIQPIGMGSQNCPCAVIINNGSASTSNFYATITSGSGTIIFAIGGSTTSFTNVNAKGHTDIIISYLLG